MDDISRKKSHRESFSSADIFAGTPFHAYISESPTESASFNTGSFEHKRPENSDVDSEGVLSRGKSIKSSIQPAHSSTTSPIKGSLRNLRRLSTYDRDFNVPGEGKPRQL